jgi:glycosyltransferase involved in cell wall biosynthesis
VPAPDGVLKVLIVSGIWPPDIGGPASHGPDLGRFLAQRGHRVRAVASTADGRPELFGFPVRPVRRDRPLPVRLPAALVSATAAARGADVVYGTGGMHTRTAIAAALTGRPLVVKLVNDPAYDRARRLGFFDGSVEEFERAHRDPRIRALKAARLFAFTRATRIVTPGRYLADAAVGWGVPRERIRVVPNPAAPVDTSIAREELRRRFGMAGPTLVFAGRLVPQKNVPLAVRALADAPGVSLVVVGSGEEEDAIRAAVAEVGVGDRVMLRPAMPRAEAVQWVRAADAAVLPSDWEGSPHAAVEALSVGTPLVATAVGAVPEFVVDGENGLLVPPGHRAALARAMASLAADPSRLERLRRGAALTGDRYAPERTFGAIEEEIRRAAGERRPVRARS